jgi:hypothetical protein
MGSDAESCAVRREDENCPRAVNGKPQSKQQADRYLPKYRRESFGKLKLAAETEPSARHPQGYGGLFESAAKLSVGF